MNRLHLETSPYLLQHAHNPVHWFAWGDEAFEEAQRQNKPVLVSIGYATCHWCHVMERESFENVDTAAKMNEWFINIKVDREERPDVDHVYMEACQALTGGGGWPLHVFLLPDKRPFYAGTYFPPTPMYNRPSWIQVLGFLQRAYHEEHAKVLRQAEQLTEQIGRAASTFVKILDAPLGEGGDVFSSVGLYNAYHSLQAQFDEQYGGFGGAPKFPGSMALLFLLRHYQTGGEQGALNHVQHSVRAMLYGGIYDQLGGGFARYATDRAWMIPHFEKMLYDNALLVKLLAELYKQAPSDLYRNALEETLTFVQRELANEQGGFYAALDADSEGVEGKYYVWQLNEITSVLDAPSAQLFCAYYNVLSEGNWEHTNILYRTLSDHNDPALATYKKLQPARSQLLGIRNERIRPLLDDKSVLAWNALMCSAYVSAYQALGNILYKNTAVAALQFMNTHLACPPDMPQALFYHTYKHPQAQYHALLDDYAYLIQALLDVYSISFDTGHLHQALQLADFVLTHFHNPESPLLYYTSIYQTDLPVRTTEIFDNALPSGNSMLAYSLLRLSIIFDRPHLHQRALRMIAAISQSIQNYPQAFGKWAETALHTVHPPYEIVLAGADAHQAALQLQQHPLPNVLLFIVPPTPMPNTPPILQDKPAHPHHRLTAYICRSWQCQQPVHTVADVLTLIGQ